MNKKTNIVHIVESIDVYDEITLVFTNDSKYIPIEDVEIVLESTISIYFIKVFKNEKIEPWLELDVFNKLKKFKLISFNFSNKEKILSDLQKYKNRYHQIWLAAPLVKPVLHFSPDFVSGLALPRVSW